MGDVALVSLLEELIPYANKKGIIEIVTRAKNGTIKKISKIAIDSLKQPEVKEKLEEALSILKKNAGILDGATKALNTISKLSAFSLVLNGLNLCATCAGFAIMYVKLDKISGKIDQIVTLHKATTGVHVKYEFNKIISDHSDMLDCRKKQNYYSEEQMRKLVSDEYNALELLIDVFSEDISNNKDTLIFSILSLASMLAVSIKYFDEIYYFKNKEAIGDGDIWHLDHNKWTGIFDKLLSSDFINKIQDYGFLDIGLNTFENDCFYASFVNQIESLKQEIEDNQTLIKAVDNQEILKKIAEETTKEVRNEVEEAFKEANVDIKVCEEALRVATA